jgi:hypothetical protein
MLLAEEPIEVGPLYVNALKRSGKIKKNEFSFAMNGLDDDMSFVDFGAPLAKRIQGGKLSSMEYINLFEDFFWSTEWKGVAFGDLDNAYSGADTYTIFDTGTSHLFLPPTVFEPFVMEMLKVAGDPEYLIESGMVFVECAARSQF